jgi:cobalt-zinc-cadmium efflux system membrane fusion protein
MNRSLSLSSIGAALLLAGCGQTPPASAPPSAAAPAPARQDGGRIVLPAGSPKLKLIRVATVETRAFPVEEVTAPGKVEVNPNRVSRVVMPLAGRIREVLVKLGDAVDAGQPLLSIDSPDASQATTTHAQAQSQLRLARLAQLKSEKDLNRARELYQHRAIALKEVHGAEQELAQARSAVEQALAAEAGALQRIETLGLRPGAVNQSMPVRAPIRGKVIEIAVAPGEFRNDTSAALMTIADLSSVWITSNVAESSIRLIQRGERVDIELAAFPGELFHGRVERIADMVDPQTRTVKVQAELANPAGRFRPEMFGSIRHSHGSRVLPAAPASALVHWGGGPAVLVEAAAGEFQRVAVTFGEPRDGLTPILSGLKGGERIVTDGAVLLAGR